MTTEPTPTNKTIDGLEEVLGNILGQNYVEVDSGTLLTHEIAQALLTYIKEEVIGSDELPTKFANHTRGKSADVENYERATRNDLRELQRNRLEQS